MQTKVTKNSDSTVTIAVELSPDELKPYLARAAEELSKERPIEGFRPGKASYQVLKERYGEAAILERAVPFAVNGVMPQIIAEHTLKLVGRPEVSVKKLAPGNPLEFSLKSALVPEFSLPDVESIAKKVLKTKIAPNVEEKEIDEALRWLQEERGELKLVSRPAREGDDVEIDFEMSDGDSPISEPSKNHPLTIGKGTMVPGFEEALIGMQVGDEKKFSLLVPESHAQAALRGKKMDFSVRMNEIKEKILPELNDDFAKTIGRFNSMDEMRQSVHEGIGEEKKIKEKDRIRVRILDSIATEVSIVIPEVMVAQELEKMLAELRESIESMGLKYDDYLSHLKKTEEVLKKDMRPDAERRVKIALVLRKIAEAQHLDPAKEDVDEEMQAILSRFKSPEEAKKQVEPQALRSYARGIRRNELVFQYLEGLE
ncbi:MAG: trigger factor [Candidatus Sungbacteria bacterium]|uniref:Trigger factor n=1 Tax=Candidatus Sungiibacteriota bacterium TaxID=2750080 RepID=A0A9D6QVL0_9BACT|nr:trigger factor [Candidatus Sungbacteria bacterium]